MPIRTLTMAKHVSSNSDSETPGSADSSSADDPETQSPNKAQNAGISEYEEQRLSRIAENRARMEALGLNKIASSFMGSAQKVSNRKGKGKMVKDADEDYRPNTNDEDDDDDDNGEDEDDDDDDDFKGSRSSGSRQRKVKNKGLKPKMKLLVENPLNNSDYIDEDDELQKAIALSLLGRSHTLNDKKGNSHVEEDTGKRKKRKTLFTPRVQMTEDELAVHFCQFDEAGKGNIIARDIRKLAAAHDFEWTDREISDMIYCFDSNGDGKLSFDDFQKIVGRCNMIQGSGNS